MSSSTRDAVMRLSVDAGGLLLRRAWLFAISGFFAVRASPQSAPARVLTPEFVVQSAIARHPAVRDMQTLVAQTEGAFVASTGLFEPTLRLSVQNSNDFSLTSSGSNTLSERIARNGYGVTASRLFSSGIVLSPSVTVTRSAFAARPDASASQATVGLTALVPLLKDRGGHVSGSGVRSARLSLAAAEASLAQTVAQAAADGLSAYWNLVAARLRLSVYADNEARAARIVADTRALVEGDERTLADLHQVEANLAAKRVARISAEQTVVESQQQLAIIVGADPRLLPDWGTVRDSFPDTLTTTGDRDAARYIDLALRLRADLLAARGNENAGRFARDGARDDERPRLDALFSIGYSGLTQSAGTRGLIAPLVQNVPGPAVTVQMRYDIPAGNQGARGRAAQAEAFLLQRRVAREELERSIISGVLVAAAGLHTAQAVMAGADTTVILANRAVTSELRKFRLGASTVFEVIQSQDALTNAALTRIGARRGYVGALITLRLQTGTLVTRVRDEIVLVESAFTTLP